MGDVSFLADQRGYLLDTHTFLWAVQEPARLGRLSRQVIESSETTLYLSAISAYEVSYKHRLGKLQDYAFVVENYAEVMRRLSVVDLPIALAHSYQAGTMEWEHRDPFDRLLVAQAALENLTLITDDERIRSHPWVTTVW
ncbi:MAG: type II toxin-antitoxin system VapC family toxin [Coriobacteriales bacterium]|jgi:PIN domain nuclease of toxin-antitoxin system|nr:type II toxin-antitoxin system VapC family toxin [Coriobacteriales bacterium]